MLPRLPEALYNSLKTDVSLKRLNSWHVGGIAKNFFVPNSLLQIKELYQLLPPDFPRLILGLGSNILIQDEPLDEWVISLHKGLTGLTVNEDEHTIYAEAGTTCAKVAKVSARLGFTHGEFFSGIPGTIGGALFMNAGAFGRETWSILKYIDVMDVYGNVHRKTPQDFRITYRHVEGLKTDLILGGCFQFQQSECLELPAKNIAELLKKRANTQPIGTFSCGSVFINPPGTHAGKLIEQVGLKGFKIGGAEVSKKHANFIVNQGDASACDILQLIEHIQRVVLEKFGVCLKTEVKLFGKKLAWVRGE